MIKYLELKVVKVPDSKAVVSLVVIANPIY